MNTSSERQWDPLAYARDEGVRRRWLSELCALLEFPSVSAVDRHRPDVEASARWLVHHLRGLGLRHAELLPGPNGGLPSVYAEHLLAEGQPTLLLYGHFDVQPAALADGWRSPPFQPTLVGERLFARGASDDKGQLFAHLKAVESWLATRGRLPINVKIWLEGEEEINSPHLAAFLDRESSRLRADAALVSDTEMPAPGHPAIVLGLRGNVSFELEVRGPNRDVHSGRYGGAVRNPLEALCDILARLHGPDGRVAVPGFYRGVREWSPAARRYLQAHGPSETALLRRVGLSAGWGEPGYSALERATIRPALTVTGMQGGSTSGHASVIPARAGARLAVRIVPDQDPREIARLVGERITSLAPTSVRLRVRCRSASSPVDISPEHAVFGAVDRAVRAVWGAPPVYTRSGGSIAAVAQLTRRLGVPVVVLGLGLPDDAIHAPNEHLHLSQFFRGVETVTRLFRELAR